MTLGVILLLIALGLTIFSLATSRVQYGLVALLLVILDLLLTPARTLFNLG